MAQNDIAPFWLSSRDKAAIGARLSSLGWLCPGETIDNIERAGDGNLNLVLRITAAGRSVILKQARPWVEKYPDIPAPVERSAVEAGFYRLVEQNAALRSYMPALVAADHGWHLLLLEDLGTQGDATDLYRGATLSAEERAHLIRFLVALHAITNVDARAQMPGNSAMIALNHHYIFHQSFSSDSADAGLALVAATLGERYLAGHGVMLHGDFYPGAWVRTPAGLRIIDPEFCLFGPREFDLGIMAAHLMIAGGAATAATDIGAHYEAAGGGAVDAALIARFTGVEIWRRLLGVAQLPLAITDAEREQMINLARRLIHQ